MAQCDLSAPYTPAPCAAVIYGDDTNANGVVERFARSISRQGLKVRGLVQQRPNPEKRCAGAIYLVDLESDDSYPISQNLGSESTACTLDPSGIAEASQVLRRALADPPDLLVISKFGKLEADGRGLIAELMDALVRGVPVITTVHHRHVDRWREMTGDFGDLLPADENDLYAWWDRSHAA